LNKEYHSAVSSRHPLEVNATTIVLVETKEVTEEGEVKCKGEKFDYKGKHYEDLVISHQLAITLVEDTALINPDGTLVINQEEIILACQASENSCTTDQATYLWDTPTEPEKCLYIESRRTKGTVVTTEAGHSTYMSTDGSMVRLLLKEEPIAACGRLVTTTPPSSWPSRKTIPALAAGSTLRTPPSTPTSMHRTTTCITAVRGVS
jgi:hypothetical protein